MPKFCISCLHNTNHVWLWKVSHIFDFILATYLDYLFMFSFFDAGKQNKAKQYNTTTTTRKGIFVIQKLHMCPGCHSVPRMLLQIWHWWYSHCCLTSSVAKLPVFPTPLISKIFLLWKLDSCISVHSSNAKEELLSCALGICKGTVWSSSWYYAVWGITG